MKPLFHDAQIVREAFTEAFPSQMSRFPVAVVIINVLPEEVDVNLEPNKTSVLLHNMVSGYRRTHQELNFYLCIYFAGFYCHHNLITAHSSIWSM